MPDVREEIDVRYEVLIDELGQPDMRMLKVTGKGSGSSHAAIEDWVRSSAFRPAMKDGQPVAAVITVGCSRRFRSFVGSHDPVSARRAGMETHSLTLTQRQGAS